MTSIGQLTLTSVTVVCSIIAFPKASLSNWDSTILFSLKVTHHR